MGCSFTWTISHLRQKLEHFGEQGIFSQPFQIKGDSAEDIVSMKLSVSLRDKEGSLFLCPSLEKLLSTCQQDVTIWWRFTCLIFESGVKKWTIPPLDCPSKCSQEVSINVPVGLLDHGKLSGVKLTMDVLWPEKKRDSAPRDQDVTPLFKEFEVMLAEGKFSDMNLVCQDREFKCHKVVLAARSPVFDTMLSNENHLEVQEGKVKITDMDHDKLEVFLKYLYCGKFSDDMKLHAKDLFVAADKYQVEDLKLAAIEALADNVNSGNAIDMLILADLYNVNMLKKKAMRVIIANYKTVSKQQQWQDFKKENIDFVNLIEISVENFSF